MDAYKELYSGQRFDYDGDDPKQIRVSDIAHSLARTNRYGGCFHGRSYCVLEHEVALCRYARAEGMPRKDQFHLLMHDTSEAYIGGDFPRPVKNVVPGLAAFEDKIAHRVMGRFGLPIKLPPHLKLLDCRIVQDERKRFLPNTKWGAWYYDTLNLQPLGIHLYGWHPSQAEHEFWVEFSRLTGQLRGQPDFDTYVDTIAYQ